MSLIRIRNWFLDRIPHKTIGGDCWAKKGPLMTRWYLLPMRTSPKGAALILHCFYRSDMDRACHDHPWSFITFPLHGYVEHLPDGTAMYRKPFRFYFRPAEWQHWVEVDAGKPVWTVLLKLSVRREWGFVTKEGWINWKAMNYENDCE